MYDMSTSQAVDVFRIPMSGPADISGLSRLISEGALDPRTIVAVMGKTEGNGCVNDFTREYASTTLAAFLGTKLELSPAEVEQRIAFVMSGGTEGVLSPHITVFARARGSGATAGPKRLAIGISATREFLPEEIGRETQISETAKAVEAAMIDAAIEDIADVHFVQIKCPLLTAERIQAARRRGKNVCTDDTYASMGYSRGASALGVAAALRETTSAPSAEALLSDWSTYSAVASTSAGIELMRNVVIVMGNSAYSTSRYTIGHAVMKDAIDVEAVLAAFGSAGLNLMSSNGFAARDRLVGVFAKAEASPSGEVRGARHTMLDDSDINSTRHARAAVGGLLAGFAGTGLVYVSGGAEHQGPPGGGPIAVIARAA